MNKIIAITLLAGVLAGSSLIANTLPEMKDPKPVLQVPETSTLEKTSAMSEFQSTSSPAAKKEELKDTVAVIKTKFGDIVIAFDEKLAPRTSENFKKLTREGFYNGTTFHRCVPGFVIQGGDPNSKSNDKTKHGMGGPGYTTPAEIGGKHVKGAVAAARLGDAVNPKKESSGSQFYICIKDVPFLDNEYTVFGTVIRGMDVVDKIVAQPRDQNDNPLERVEMDVKLVSRADVVAN
jgi:cyclophilin family peptidyl-prolyl cis-trans isomerase